MSDNPKKEPGKPPLELLEPSFLEAMAIVMQAGVKNGRNPNDWKLLDPIKHLDTYRGALFRHFTASAASGTKDESGESHYAAIATNVMICEYFERARIGDTPFERILYALSRTYGMSVNEARYLVEQAAISVYDDVD